MDHNLCCIDYGIRIILLSIRKINFDPFMVNQRWNEWIKIDFLHMKRVKNNRGTEIRLSPLVMCFIHFLATARCHLETSFSRMQQTALNDRRMSLVGI